MCASNGRCTLQPKTYRRKLHSGTEQVGSNMRALLILGTHHLEIWMSTNSELKTTSNANGTGDERQWRDGGRRPPRSCTKRLYSNWDKRPEPRALFSDSKKRRFGLSSVPPLLGYSPEASGTATTGEMRPRKVGHWPLWRRQRFQRRARAICSHEWTPPGPVRIHPAELRSPLTSLPQKSLVHRGGFGRDRHCSRSRF